ncbi:hypothetical protein OF83DRAFT_1087048 [Amylostereum chailletii]|nr:hypothetical protein OF83DRAFT_1087048 [Amylostereum chailletii]
MTENMQASENSAIALMLQPVTGEVQEYIVDVVLDVVNQAMDRSGLDPLGADSRPAFASFVSEVFKTSGLGMPVALVMLAYVTRVGTQPFTFVDGDYLFPETIFIGAMIHADRYIRPRFLALWEWEDLVDDRFDLLELDAVAAGFASLLAADASDTRVTMADVRAHFPALDAMFLPLCNPVHAPVPGAGPACDCDKPRTPLWWPEESFRGWYRDAYLWYAGFYPSAPLPDDPAPHLPLAVTGIPVHISRRRHVVL